LEKVRQIGYSEKAANFTNGMPLDSQVIVPALQLRGYPKCAFSFVRVLSCCYYFDQDDNAVTLVSSDTQFDAGLEC
jgi:hypothetical protein